MLDLYRELKGVTSALESAGVRYALAGGLAVSLYTRPRATKDIDLLVERAQEGAAIEALGPAGYLAHGQAVPLAGGRIHLRRLQKLAEGDYMLVDLLLAHEKPHRDVLEARVRAPSADGEPGVWVVTREGLRQLKLLRRSRQDEADLAALDEEESP